MRGKLHNRPKKPLDQNIQEPESWVGFLSSLRLKGPALREK